MTPVDNAAMDPNTVKPESLAAQSLGWVDPVTKAISPAIHASTTFIRDADNQYRNGRSAISLRAMPNSRSAIALRP